MAAPKENSLFPLNPYYIPGYEGFVPQYKYRFGETYGRSTYRLLTEPGVGRSPRSLLAPLRPEKFLEDFSGSKHGTQGYPPGPAGYFPYEKAGAATAIPEQVLGPKPLLPWPEAAEEEMVMKHMDPVPEHHPGDYVPRTREPRGEPRSTSQHPDSEGTELSPAWGQGQRCGAGQLGGALAGSTVPVEMEAVALPKLAGAVDVEQDLRLPKLDVPNLIQQKVISGYTGFIPRLCWVHGASYLQAVKEAMNEFDQLQLSERSPTCSPGKRYPRSYLPKNKIYTSAGLIPFYTGFVPKLRDTYALTFGDGTRAAYHKK
ncbi:ciliary microtubule inner protein 2A [Pogoniulus pusillus]|uniref:ciliary microtubule inner protein 2A n=1 Tax=Pogoniulus pusillus TaxID=488313 RepID=UPI0030B93FF2